MRNSLYLILLSLLCSFSLLAQEGKSVYQSLRFPSSARANALGGYAVALIERDPSLAFHNPGLLGGEMDGMVNINYMNYISDINVGSALFSKAHNERGAWAIGVSYINYGHFKEALPGNTVVGDFSVSDVNLQGIYSYDLSDRWRGGISLKMLYSHFAEYTSFGIAAEAGLSYFNSETDFSFGFVLKNVGAQLKAYDTKRQPLPWDIQLGITKKLAHAPFRFSVMAMHLNQWEFDYIDTVESDKSDSFFQTFAKHLVLGVDFIPSDNFWIGVGFNPKKNLDMRLQNGNTLAGFSAGAGVEVKMFDIGISLAKYHPSAMSLMVSVSMTLGDFNL